MGLVPSGNGENHGKSEVAKVPVPIFSQPRRELQSNYVAAKQRPKSIPDIDFQTGFLHDVEFAGSSLPAGQDRRINSCRLWDGLSRPSSRPERADLHSKSNSSYLARS